MVGRAPIPRYWKSPGIPTIRQWVAEVNYTLRMEELLATANENHHNLGKYGPHGWSFLILPDFCLLWDHRHCYSLIKIHFCVTFPGGRYAITVLLGSHVRLISFVKCFLSFFFPPFFCLYLRFFLTVGKDGLDSKYNVLVLLYNLVFSSCWRIGLHVIIINVWCL